jgi:hypothetical protein
VHVSQFLGNQSSVSQIEVTPEMLRAAVQSVLRDNFPHDLSDGLMAGEGAYLMTDEEASLIADAVLCSVLERAGLGS